MVNHVTEFDPFLLMHFLADNGHAVRALIKDSLMRVPVLKHVMRATKMVPVARNSSAATDALKHAKRAIAEGESILIFPEGTLTRDPDMWPMTFKTGAARLALATSVPVIPVAHWGGHAIMHRFREGLPKLGRKPVSIVAGPAIDLSDLPQDEDNRDAVWEATRRMENTMTRMVAQLRGQEPPAGRWHPKLGRYVTAEERRGGQ